MSSGNGTLPSGHSCGWSHIGGDDNIIPDVLEGETQLVKELNDLVTAKEREQVYEELHGVAHPVQETPEMIERCLQELRRELTNTPRRKRRTFGRALFLKPGILQDDKFLLMFLRCDRYDAMKAAQRMYSHYDFKLMLFGEDKLAKKITLDDLDEEAMVVMRRGGVRAMSQKDRTGRTVMFVDVASFLNVNWASLARYVFYQSLVLAEDEHVQKHGVVDIMNFLGIESIPGDLIDFTTRTRKMMENLPLRRCGLHICFDHPTIQAFIKFQRIVIGKENRLRVRTHFGSGLDIYYSLMTFGISVEGLGCNGDFRRMVVAKTMEKYIESRQQVESELKKEEGASDESYVEYPAWGDILVGRGRPYQDHSGSNLLAEKVSLWADRYEQAWKRTGKAVISLEIYDTIQKEGGRFLRRTSNGWEAVEEHVAREKISKALWYEMKQRADGASKLQDDRLTEDEPSMATAGATCVSPRSTKRRRFRYQYS